MSFDKFARVWKRKHPGLTTMAPVPYNFNDSSGYYNRYYRMQAGGELPVYSGRPIMGGYGLGGIFSSGLRMVTPFLKKVGKTLGKKALKTGVSIANDVLSGKNLKTSLKENVSATGKTLLKDVLGAVGSGSAVRARNSPHSRKRKRQGGSAGGATSKRRRQGGNSSVIRRAGHGVII